MLQVQKPSIVFAALLLGGLALLLAAIQVVSGGTLQLNRGNVAALKQIMEDPAAPNNMTGASDYLTGVTEHHRGDYADALRHLQAAATDYGTFARHWLALTLEQQGKPNSARQILDLNNDAELALYGDILLREWDMAPVSDKTGYLALLQKRQPDWIILYANRLIDTNHAVDAVTWAEAVPNYESSPGSLLALGVALSLVDGSLDRATTILKRAYEADRSSMSAYRYGTALIETGAPGKGIAVLEEAIAAALNNDPLLPLLSYQLAAGYALSGRCADAVTALARSAAGDQSETHKARVAAAAQALSGECPRQ